MEGDTGTRRYKWFRPRQAARGGVPTTTASSAHFATIGLFNSSTGPTVLVVRDWSAWLPSSTIVVLTGYNQGRLSGTNYPASRLFPGDPSPAGLLDYSNQAGKLAGDYTLEASLNWIMWTHDFPIAVVPPGWTLFFQHQSAANPLAVSLLWEEVSIDELEYFYY